MKPVHMAVIPGLLAVLSLAACLGGQSGTGVLEQPPALAELAVCPCALAERGLLARGTVIAAGSCRVEVVVDELLGGEERAAVAVGDQVAGLPLACSAATITAGQDVVVVYAPAAGDGGLDQLMVRPWAIPQVFEDGSSTTVLPELELLIDGPRCEALFAPRDVLTEEESGSDGMAVDEGAQLIMVPVGPDDDPGLVPVEGPTADDEQLMDESPGCPASTQRSAARDG